MASTPTVLSWSLCEAVHGQEVALVSARLRSSCEFDTDSAIKSGVISMLANTVLAVLARAAADPVNPFARKVHQGLYMVRFSQDSISNWLI